MRIGKRLGIAAVGAWLAATAVTLATGADVARRVQPVPLGGSLPGQSGDHHYGVYVPTRFGGVLKVAATDGKLGPILGPDGRERANGEEVGNDAQGWYTFPVTGAEKPYSVSATFVQVGRSARKPWNFYYWPTKSDAVHEPWAGGNARVDTMQAYGDDVLVATPGSYIAPGQDIVRAGRNGLLETPPAPGDDSTWFPNLYDDLTFRGADGTMYQTPSPLLKYDQLFNTSSRGWESAAQQGQDISRWPGHCLGGAVASILLNEPTPSPGSGMTRDELKALWAELGENHYNHRIGDFATDIPPGPPRPGFDECDRFVPRFHAMLETHIRGKKQALLGNLRAFPPRGTNNEVWNHGIGRYTAKFSSIPGKGERAVKLEVEIEANAGSSLNGQDTKPRLVTYVYTLVYGLDGKVDETQAASSDWVGLSGEAMFAPLNILEVVETKWQGHNPYVSEANVRSLDMANGGGYGRLASTPPQFRPVGSYEAGRAPMFAGRTISADAPMTPSPRRGGLFRFFGGR
ncbi:MAG: hypothetical protein LC745_03075 [Planctomycetia bacterium]|nr:hypothetical protein [Planctomycetia bacterium]